MDGFCFLTFALYCVFAAYVVFINKLDDASCCIFVRASFYTSKGFSDTFCCLVGFSHDDIAPLRAFKKLQDKRCSFDQFDHIPGVVWAVGKSGYWHTDAFSGQKLETSQLVFGSSNRGRFIQAIHSHHFELSQDSQSIKGNGGANARNDSIEPIQPLLRVIDFWSMGRDAQIAF